MQVGLKLVQCSRATAEEHYAEHKGKPFYEGLVQFITSGPAVAMVWEGALLLFALCIASQPFWRGGGFSLLICRQGSR